MSASVNMVVLIGRLTKDPELRKTSAGASYCRFTVACDRLGKEQGADFVQVTAWGQSADFLGNYGRKGNITAVQGSIRTGSYTNKEGQTVYTTEVAAFRVQLIKEQQSSGNQYSNMGTPLRKDEIDATDGFENAEGPIDPDDIPF